MSARDKKIVIVLIGFIVLALAYFLVFMKAQEEREVLKVENANLQSQYDDLSLKASQSEMYKTETAKMNEEMEAIYTKFPSYLKIENGIMDVVELENATNSFVSSFTVGEPSAKDVIVENPTANTDASTDAQTTDNQTTGGTTDGTTDTTQTDNTGVPYQLYDVSTIIEFQSGYAGTKSLINMVVGDSEKKTIDTLNLTYDSGEGKMTGSMLYDTYFLYGLDKPYEAPTIPNINHGTQNVFGTVN